MARVEEELGLVLEVEQVKLLFARAPTSPSPRCEVLVDVVPRPRALSGSSGRLAVAVESLRGATW